MTNLGTKAWGGSQLEEGPQHWQRVLLTLERDGQDAAHRLLVPHQLRELRTQRTAVSWAP